MIHQLKLQNMQTEICVHEAFFCVEIRKRRDFICSEGITNAQDGRNLYGNLFQDWI